MRNAGGFACISWDHGAVEEMDTFSCGHCNKVVHVKAGCSPYDLGGMCRPCAKMICPVCVKTGRCDPLEEQLKRVEMRHEALRSYGLA